MELSFLGAGFPLFYNFIKYCIFILVVLFLVSGIPNAYLYHQGKFCSKTQEEIVRDEDQAKV